MARFLFTNWPLLGHLHPHLALARSLRLRGHTTAFFTSMRVRDVIEAENHRFFAFQGLSDNLIDRLLATKRTITWRRPLATMELFTKWLLETIPDQVHDIET